MATILRILFLCLVAGLLLSWFAIDPRTLLTGGIEAAREAWRMMLTFGGWAIPYVLLGATVVLPLVAIGAVLRLLNRRRRGP